MLFYGAQIGNPGGLDSTVTFGIVSHLNRPGAEVIPYIYLDMQHDSDAVAVRDHTVKCGKRSDGIRLAAKLPLDTHRDSPDKQYQ